ncbi:hypothetical protein ABQG65_22495 [Yersinia alsatica]|uniref:hypothetical protein n=1 Tax=Yersinia alsatica TaxID=2890317 RepID=UPI0005E9DDF5|nr:Uncharacterised protein [Yersinia frederiksenii]
MITVNRPTEEEMRDFLLRKYIEEQLNQEAEEDRKMKEEKYKQRLMKVSPALFLRFLEEKGVSLRCPSCNSSELSIPESFTMRSEKLPASTGSSPDTQQRDVNKLLSDPYVSYIPLGNKLNLSGLIKSYYQIHCNNCGHLSLYRTVTVLKWLENFDRESDEE